MKYKIVILFFILFLSSFSLERKIFIVKNYWHTGIIIPVDTTAIEHLSLLQKFQSSKYVDVGMGEKDFFMRPSRDALPAARAILIPTDATIRIAEVPGDTAFIKRTSDFMLEMRLDIHSFKKLLKFFDSSMTKNENNQNILIEAPLEGKIHFYESTESYHLFNTCNTWLARGLEFAGIEIDPDNVITSKELFRELLGKTRVIKFDNSDSIF